MKAIPLTKRRTIKLFSVLASICFLLTNTGCSWHQPKSSGVAPDTKVGAGSISKPRTAKTANSAKGTLASKVEGQKTAAPIKMTSSQKLGVSVLTALNSALNNPLISVGTTQDTIILNGTVKNESERQRAGLIARQAGPKYKVINQLKVTAKPKKTASPQKSAKTAQTTQTTQTRN